MDDEETVNCEEAWKALVTDSSLPLEEQTLDVEELTTFMTMMGQKVKLKDIVRMVSDIDHRNRGYVNYSQFKRIIIE